VPVPVLPDLLRSGLRLVICGSAAGTRSAALGAYYAGPGNRFWPMLHNVGATPSRLAPADYPSLLAFGIGLTDMAKETSGADSTLAAHHFDRTALAAKIVRHQPAVLAFNGKRAAGEFFARPVDYGYQAGQDIGGTRLFVAPSTSGAARRFWNEEIWRMVADAAGFER
jgi:TDG/mug DNA glycosylase family protein